MPRPVEPGHQIRAARLGQADRLDPKVRADDVEVAPRPSDGASLGPYRCAEFLDG
ncbi:MULTISPECIES: hypothetical protein [Streptomyces]|uniref:hypothetical protein n=1 Tax=Streptomyces TaxID=1883 RepID=UPI003398F39B|nr:hypothetical protein OG987_25335 [Streptomyces sp. NBC_01620]